MKFSNILKYLFILSLLLLSSISSTYAIPIVNYAMDEGFGAVLFDSANIGKTAIIVNKPKHAIWSLQSKHGLGSVGIQAGKQDNFEVLPYPQLTPQLNNFTIEFEYKPLTPVGVTETLFDKLGSYTFSITPTAQPIQPLPPALPILKIPDGTLTLNIGLLPVIIPISNISYGSFNSLIITFNGTAYSIYNNGILQGLPILSISPIALSPASPLSFFDIAGGGIQSFSGLIDEFMITNTYLNSSQALNIFNTGLIIQNNISVIIHNNLIKNISLPINNKTYVENLPIKVLLTETGTCNLYVDNNFKKTYTNVLAFTDLISFNKNYGQHTSFFNCFNQNFNEISNTLKFNITKIGNSNIQFIFTGTDFNINSMPFELVTPCLNKGFTLGGALDSYRPLANPLGAQFKDLVGGIAKMNLTLGTHEFCLINGIISYNSYNHTKSWQPTKVIKQIQLGKFDLPNNLTSSYTISLSKFDIYDKTNPKAWGQTWTSLISSILAFVLGLAILGAGATTGSKQAVLIGGLLIMFSLGYQITNLFLGVF